MNKKIFKNIVAISSISAAAIGLGTIGMISCSSNNSSNDTVDDEPSFEDQTPTSKTNLNLSTSSTKYINGTTLTIPSNFVSISGSLQNTNITKINIQGAVSSLPNNCFADCENLESITFSFSDSLKTIGDSSFSGCTKLTIEIPKNVTSIGVMSFSSVKEVTFESNSNLNTINNYAFMNAQFSSINLPDSVETLGSNAFYNCNQLTSFKFPKKVTQISDGLFNNCYALKSITFSEITSIGQWAFNNCTGLIELNNLPNSLNIINSFAFAYCRNLTTITIPSSVSGIGGQIFMGCSSLNNITLPNGFNQSELSPSGSDSQKQLGLTSEQWNKVHWVI